MTARRVEVVRTYLELRDPSELRPSRTPPPGARFGRLAPCPTDLYRRLYRDVGELWYWHDRLEWSDETLAAHLARPEVVVWQITFDGRTAGYFELQRHEDGSVEIAYFGLMPECIGRGLGGAALTKAVQQAWAMGATRVWLHTCTLDSERALPNYRARGFREFKRERLEVVIDGSRVVSEQGLSATDSAEAGPPTNPPNG